MPKWRVLFIWLRSIYSYLYPLASAQRWLHLHTYPQRTVSGPREVDPVVRHKPSSPAVQVSRKSPVPACLEDSDLRKGNSSLSARGRDLLVTGLPTHWHALSLAFSPLRARSPVVHCAALCIVQLRTVVVMAGQFTNVLRVSRQHLKPGSARFSSSHAVLRQEIRDAYILSASRTPTAKVCSIVEP